MSAVEVGHPDAARRAMALTIGSVSIAASAVGSALALVAPADALRRVGLYYESPSEVSAASIIVFEATVVLVLLVGMLIAIRLPAHPIGWILLTVGALFAIGAASQGYMLQAFATDPAMLPAADVVAWVANWVWGPALAVLGLTLLLFPTGRSLSKAWTGAFAILFAVSIIGMALYSVTPGPMPQTLGVLNPFGIEAIGAIPTTLVGAVFLSVVGLPLLGAASMVVRYRKGSPIERLQLKWVAAASALVAIVIAALVARGPWDELSDLALYSALVAFPIAIGIAILRQGLYAIDLIIRRTLIYGSLTASLGAIYVVGIIVLQAILGDIAGQNGLAIAGATLLVAATFRPLRSRLQDAIDRRFYRVHYDSARTIMALAARIRDEVELEAIEADLMATVVEAVKPARAALWRRGIEGPFRSSAR